MTEFPRTDPEELPSCSDLDRGHDLFFTRGPRLWERLRNRGGQRAYPKCEPHPRLWPVLVHVFLRCRYVSDSVRQSSRTSSKLYVRSSTYSAARPPLTTPLLGTLPLPSRQQLMPAGTPIRLSPCLSTAHLSYSRCFSSMAGGR